MTSNAVRAAVMALALACVLPAGADYEAGQQAWDAGRPDEALAEWRAAADTGDRRAMLALGRLYAQGPWGAARLRGGAQVVQPRGEPRGGGGGGGSATCWPRR